MFQLTKTLRHAAMGIFTAAMIGGAGSASAAILYYDEYTNTYDPIETALVNLGLSFTEVTDEAAFNTALGGGGFDLVIFLEESTTHGSSRTLLEAHILGGGSAIYNSYFPGSFASVFEATEGATNSTDVAITDPALASGMSSASFALLNPGFGIFSVELTPTGGGVSGGTLGGGSAVVIGNGGRTIMNSFLTETFANQLDEVQFYENEISYLLGTTDVPLPAALPLAVAGFGLLGLVARTRRKSA